MSQGVRYQKICKMTRERLLSSIYSEHIDNITANITDILKLDDKTRAEVREHIEDCKPALITNIQLKKFYDTLKNNAK